MALSTVPSCLGLRMSRQLVNLGCVQQEMRFWSCGRYMMKVAHIIRPRILPCVKAKANGLQVFVLSDLHTDYPENMAWVRGLSKTAGQNKDVLLVAGDVAETRNNFVLTMSLLKDRFAHVFFVPGNHDLWLRREKDSNALLLFACSSLRPQDTFSFFDVLICFCLKGINSLEKLDELLDACQRIGVETNPTVVDGLGIIPLFSWYHESFDREKDITSIRIPSLELACKDYNACRWPAGLINGDTSLALYFDAMNDKKQEKVSEMQGRCHQIISFSHFVPRQELCPEKRMLFYPNLPKIAGSDFLEARIRHIHGAEGSAFVCHVFGHTHFCWDAVVDGIRYVQAPLAYPRERKKRMNGGEEWLPYCIYSCGEFSEQVIPCYWSDYYAVNPRTPEITELAPWVARFYRRSS